MQTFRFESSSATFPLVGPRVQNSLGDDPKAVNYGCPDLVLSGFGVLVDRRIQAVDAMNSANRSDGFMNPSRLRGRSLRLRATASRSARVSPDKSMPFGMY